MAYSKKAAEQNRKIEARANKILDGSIDEQNVLEILKEEFPEVDRNRLRRRIDKLSRERYGQEVRARSSNWGGKRPNQTGRPPLADDEKRVKVTTWLAPGSKELAIAIAEVYGLPGWGHAVGVALARMVATDQGLRVRLAEMGIILRGEDVENPDRSQEF